MQFADERFRAELAAWSRPNRSQARDGIPGYALGFGNLLSSVAPTVIRHFDLGARHARTDAGLARNAPVLAVLTTQDESLRELLAVDGFPQVCLRVGYGAPTRAVPRRPVEDVLEVGG